jgi:RimJ/RimL family protein N-acetyltransferase
MPPHILQDGRVTLRPITYDDTANIVRWRNSPEVQSRHVRREDISEESHKQYMRKYVDTGKVHQFIIHVDDADLDIGTIFIKNIDPERGCAEAGIFIGVPKYLNSGIGIFADRLLGEYVKNELKLKYTYCRVVAEYSDTIRRNQFLGSRIIDNPRDWGIQNPDNPDVVYMVHEFSH